MLVDYEEGRYESVGDWCWCYCYSQLLVPERSLTFENFGDGQLLKRYRYCCFDGTVAAASPVSE